MGIEQESRREPEGLTEGSQKMSGLLKILLRHFAPRNDKKASLAAATPSPHRKTALPVIASAARQSPENLLYSCAPSL